MAGAAVDTSGATRERILQAALECFSANGFEGARTRDIAARAGVPLGLLRYHVGDKAKLWRSAVDRAFAQLHAGIDGILAEPGPDDVRARLRRLVRDHVRFVGRNPEFVRLMHDEGKRGGPRMRWMVDRHVKPMFERLVPLIERAQGEGILPADVHPIHFLYTLAGAAGVIFHQAAECRRVAGFDPTEADAIEAHADACEHLFLGTHRARAGS